MIWYVNRLVNNPIHRRSCAVRAVCCTFKIEQLKIISQMKQLAMLKSNSYPCNSSCRQTHPKRGKHIVSETYPALHKRLKSFVRKVIPRIEGHYTLMSKLYYM